MKIFNKDIDERQEQELLKLGYIGYWFSFWLLCAVFFIQILFFSVPFQQIIGEAIVLFVVTAFWLWGCIRKGLWNSPRTTFSVKIYPLLLILTVTLDILIHISSILIRYGFSEERLMNYFPISITGRYLLVIMVAIVIATKIRISKLEEKYQDDEESK